MMIKHATAIALTVGIALTLGACAGDSMLGGMGPTTAALPEKPKVDASCAPLAARIDTLRKDGVAERVAQASQGKGTTVSVKRESLGKVAELNKANADFQAKCSTYSMPATTAAAPAAAPIKPPMTPTAAPVIAKAAKTAAVATPTPTPAPVAIAAPVVATPVAAVPVAEKAADPFVEATKKGE